jgi:hypothetical protein
MNETARRSGSTEPAWAQSVGTWSRGLEVHKRTDGLGLETVTVARSTGSNHRNPAKSRPFPPFEEERNHDLCS